MNNPIYRFLEKYADLMVSHIVALLILFGVSSCGDNARSSSHVEILDSGSASSPHDKLNFYKIKLPVISHQNPTKSIVIGHPRQIYIYVDKHGNVFSSYKKVSVEKVKKIIDHGRVKYGEEVKIYLVMDRSLKTKQMSEIIDALRENNCRKTAIIAEFGKKKIPLKFYTSTESDRRYKKLTMDRKEIYINEEKKELHDLKDSFGNHQNVEIVIERNMLKEPITYLCGLIDVLNSKGIIPAISFRGQKRYKDRPSVIDEPPDIDEL